MGLIDREELIRQIRLQANRSSLGETSCRELTFGEVAGLIMNAPTVDAEPVVRCKDCEFKRTSPFGEQCMLVYCTLCKKGMQYDDYCSYGKREDGE